MVGPAATHDEWMIPRDKSALCNLSNEQITRIASIEEFGETFCTIFNDQLSMIIEGPDGLCAELTKQKGVRQIHLVNYHSDRPIENISVTLHLACDQHMKTVILASPEHENDIQLPFRINDSAVTFTVPKVNIYEIAILTLK